MGNVKTGVYARMEELGLSLPPPQDVPLTLELLKPLNEKILYVSGMGPNFKGEEPICGKVPTNVSQEEAYKLAQKVALNALSTLDQYLGDLNRITSFIKLLGFVASDPSYTNQHIVINGASELLIDLFGEKVGKAARSAIGVASLPFDFPVEIEMLVEYK